METRPSLHGISDVMHNFSLQVADQHNYERFSLQTFEDQKESLEQLFALRGVWSGLVRLHHDGISLSFKNPQESDTIQDEKATEEAFACFCYLREHHWSDTQMENLQERRPELAITFHTKPSKSGVITADVVSAQCMGLGIALAAH
ncbi:hypothetical protein BTVI_131908 [Pitangus sulphuratus]|nr:hypothetical protein BTVI_131908 [Pitangus sulphuratus]